MSSENAALRRVRALTAKDMADLVKNPGVAVCLVIPIALIALQTLVVGGDASAAMEASREAAAMVNSVFLQSSLCMTIAMLGSMAVLYSLAEEKEKHTLRTLILSNVSAGQIMVSKAIVGLVAIVGVAAVCFGVVWYLLPGVDAGLLPAYLVCVFAGALTVVVPSLVLGLACRDQMTASFYSVPVVLLALAPIFGSYDDAAANVVRFCPTGGVCQLLDMVVTDSFTWGDAALPAIVTVAWIVLGAIAFRMLYRKLASDN